MGDTETDTPQDDPAANIQVLDEVKLPEPTPQSEPEPEPEPVAEEDDPEESSEDEPEFEEDEPEQDEGDEDDGLGLDELLGGEQEEAPPKRNKTSAKKRIRELTARRHEAENRARAAEQANQELTARIDALEKKLTPNDANDTVKRETSDKEPSPDDFKYGEFDPEYLRASTAFAVKKAVEDVKTEQEAERKTQADAQKAQEIAQKYGEKVDAGNSQFDDFQEKVIDRGNRGEYPLTEHTVMMALDSDVGHKVLYDIASNLKLARQLAGMDETQQARAFGRLEARHAATAEPKEKPKSTVTKAPPPPSRRSRGTGGRKGLDPKTASIEDLEKKWLADGRI